MTDRSNHTKFLVFATAAVVLAAAVIGGYFFLSRGTVPTTKRDAPRELVVFPELPQSATIQDAVLTSRSKTFNLATEQAAVVLSDEQRENFYLPYHLDAKVAAPAGSYDLAWDLDKDGVNYSVTLDGFPPFTPVAVSMNDNFSTGSYGTDWSGRTVVEFILNIEMKMNVCVTVLMSPPLKFCQLSFPRQRGVQ